MLTGQAREEAIARGEDPDLAEALILNGGVPPAAPVEVEQPVQQQTTGLEGGKKGLGISADVGWDALLYCTIHSVVFDLFQIKLLFDGCL